MLLLHATAAGGREHFVWAEIAAGIERVAEVFHGGQVGGREHLAHEADLFHADAVFAGDAATASQAFVENLVAGGQNPFYLFTVTLVEQQNRMDIAVASVKDIDDTDVVPCANLGDFSQDVRQCG